MGAGSNRAGRPEVLVKPAPPETSTIVVVSPADLERIVRAAVRAELDGARNQPASEWLDAVGVGALLGVHPRSVQKMVKHQGLPAHRLGPKLLRYRRDEVDRWVRDRSLGRRRP
jgi:excisionase family DNA binding protein